MKIVADNRIPFLKGVLEPYAEVVYLPGGAVTNEVLKDADFLITRTRTKCTRALLENTAVRHIATATIGFDHIDTADMAELGITWNNAPGCNANSVGQYFCSALMALGCEIVGKTLGVIGVGHVGSIVARYAEALGMKVLRNDPPRAAAGETGFVELEQLLAESDMVTMHVPLEYSGSWPTFHMAGEKFFEQLRKGCVFFNASRGEAVDSAALKKALKNGQVSRTVLDVWENEPEIDRELMNGSFISTMHIAGYSTDGKANGTAASVRSAARVLNIPELLEWFPDNVPEPLEARVIPFRSITETLLHTYDPRQDSDALRNAPETFEELRGSYPVRREFQAFTVTGAPETEAAILRKLGFRIG